MSRSLLPSDMPRSDMNRSDTIETVRNVLARAREAFENKIIRSPLNTFKVW